MDKLSPMLMCLIIFFLSACTPDTPDADEDLALLNLNRTLWDEQNIVNYQYTFHQTCFCIPEEDIVIHVTDNAVATAFYIPSGIFLDASRQESMLTITEFFNLIEAAINDKVDFLEVQYNPTFGYPTIISLDISENVADDEVMYLISDFQ